MIWKYNFWSICPAMTPVGLCPFLKYFVIEIVITGSRLFRSASRSPSSPSEGFKGIKIKLQYVLEGMTSYRTMFIENWKEITTFDWLKSNKGLDLRVLRMVLWRAKYGQTWFQIWRVNIRQVACHKMSVFSPRSQKITFKLKKIFWKFESKCLIFRENQR